MVRLTGSICWTIPAFASTRYARPAPTTIWLPAVPMLAVWAVASWVGSILVIVCVVRSSMRIVVPSWMTFSRCPAVPASCTRASARPDSPFTWVTEPGLSLASHASASCKAADALCGLAPNAAPAITSSTATPTQPYPASPRSPLSRGLPGPVVGSAASGGDVSSRVEAHARRRKATGLRRLPGIPQLPVSRTPIPL